MQSQNSQFNDTEAIEPVYVTNPYNGHLINVAPLFKFIKGRDFNSTSELNQLAIDIKSTKDVLIDFPALNADTMIPDNFFDSLYFLNKLGDAVSAMEEFEKGAPIDGK